MNVLSRIDELSARSEEKKPVLLLFSGGLDSCHTLSRLVSRGFPVIPLHVGLGEDLPRTCEMAARIGYDFLTVNAEDILCSEFLTDGIICDATYYGGMPLSSTYTRPLIARIAVEKARELGVRVIASNVTAFQNSFFRFAKSIAILAPEMSLLTPSIGEYVDRDRKVSEIHPDLRQFFESEDRGVYSIDTNLWCKVVENGDIEFPERPLPISFIRGRVWSRGPCEVKIGFSSGLPTSLNGVALGLRDICKALNVEFEGHPAAFFYGLEGNVFGVKNPEPRMSMAGKLIHEGAGLLAQALLSSTELQLRGDLSRRFVISAIEGGWFTSHLDALKVALQRLARPINGYVHWKIDAESCYPHRIRPVGRSKIGSHVKDFTSLIETFDISAKVSFDILKEHTDEQN